MIRRATLAVLFLLVAMVPPAVAATRAEREKARLETLRDQRATLERKLKEAESTRAEAADRLRDTEKAISSVGRKLHVLSQERSAARTELSGHEADLRRLERQVAERQGQLSHLLRYQFKPQRADALAILLAGGDPHGVARDHYYLGLLSQAQAAMISDLRRDVAAQRHLAEEVKTKERKLAELAEREEQERSALRLRQQERQAVLSKIAGDIKQQRRELATLKANEARLGKVIAALAKRQRSTPPVASTAAPRGAPAPRVPSVEPVHAGGAFARLRGKLQVPVTGTLAGRFGARREDGVSVWRGLFYRAGEGTAVRAVASGEVVFADWLRGYGNLLIIDHDNDFLSVYGNNQSLLADVGQKVGAGVTVATVGASGGQAESGLYFELRHQGQAFDPTKWLGTQ